MKHLRVARATLTFILVSLAPALAWAGNAVTADGATTDGAVDETRQAEARELFQQGVTLLDERNYRAALQAFRAAYARWDNPKILLNMATTLVALERPAEAANLYVRYLEVSSPTPERTAEVRSMLEKLAPRTARVRLKTSEGVERARIDGVDVPRDTAEPHWLAPGKHRLEVSYAGGASLVRPLHLRPGQLTQIDGTRPSEPEVPPAPPVGQTDVATVDTSSSSWLSIIARADIDGLGRGAVGAAGLAVRVLPPLRLTGGGMVGAHAGGWLGVEAFAKVGRLRPTLGASLPTFFSGGVRPAISAELGGRYELGWGVHPFARVALVHFLSKPDGYVATVVVPTVGFEVPL